MASSGYPPAFRIAFVQTGRFPLSGLRQSIRSIEGARKSIEESHCGCHTSVADYAQELTEDSGNIPSHLEMYIDCQLMGRDMELGSDIFTIETGYQ